MAPACSCGSPIRQLTHLCNTLIFRAAHQAFRLAVGVLRQRRIPARERVGIAPRTGGHTETVYLVIHAGPDKGDMLAHTALSLTA